MMWNVMTLNEKEEYELRIKNMQSKIDYLLEQRANLTTYAKKYTPLTDEEIAQSLKQYGELIDTSHEFWKKIARAIESAHGIK